MNPQVLAKARAHTEHLLDLHIGLRNKYALLAPLLPGGFVHAALRTGPGTHGLAVVRISLFLSCVQDLVKATLDRDPRAPSVVNIISVLDDPATLASLRKEYISRGSSRVPQASLNAALGQGTEASTDDLGNAFDSLVTHLRADWQHLRNTPQLTGCQTVRDKLIAHTELRPAGSSYALLDIASIGLRWTDVGALIGQLEDVVVPLNTILRNASFDFESLDAQLTAAQTDFWRPTMNGLGGK